jgi:hypothetical protein
MTSHAQPLEKRLFQHYWDDGLLDLFVGLATLAVGLCWAFDLVAIGAVIPALLTPFWTLLRRKLVEPRAGLVEFSDSRVSENRKMLIYSIILGLGMFGTFLILHARVPDLGALPGLVIPAVPALLLALLALIAGLWLGLPRFVGYAAAFCAAGIIVALADARPEIAFFAGAVVVLANGARLLTRFLRIGIEADGDA